MTSATFCLLGRLCTTSSAPGLTSNSEGPRNPETAPHAPPLPGTPTSLPLRLDTASPACQPGPVQWLPVPVAGRLCLPLSTACPLAPASLAWRQNKSGLRSPSRSRWACASARCASRPPPPVCPVTLRPTQGPRQRPRPLSAHTPACPARTRPDSGQACVPTCPSSPLDFEVARGSWEPGEWKEGAGGQGWGGSGEGTWLLLEARCTQE